MKLTTASLAILATLLLPSPTAAFAHPSLLAKGFVQHATFIRGGVTYNGATGATTALQSTSTSEVVSVSTTPIPDMRPGTSGLRKKVEVWQGKHYVENFIQCLVDTAVEKNGGEMLDT